MLDKERLLDISELNLIGKLETMSDSELEQFKVALVSFVEIFSAKEADIKLALEAEDYISASKHLTVVCEKLKEIYADELAEVCLMQIKGFNSADKEKNEAYIAYFLMTVSVLSINIQMAVYGKKTDRTVSSKPDGAERVILAVDDTTLSLNILKKLIQETPYKIVCVNSGVAALRFLENNKPDLFLLDIEMPVMNGYELAGKIREIGQTAPIIFLTGNSSQEAVTDAIKAGAADFILKPINREYVLKMIHKYIL